MTPPDVLREIRHDLLMVLKKNHGIDHQDTRVIDLFYLVFDRIINNSRDKRWNRVGFHYSVLYYKRDKEDVLYGLVSRIKDILSRKSDRNNIIYDLTIQDSGWDDTLIIVEFTLLRDGKKDN